MLALFVFAPSYWNSCTSWLKSQSLPSAPQNLFSTIMERSFVIVTVSSLQTVLIFVFTLSESPRILCLDFFEWQHVCKQSSNHCWTHSSHNSEDTCHSEARVYQDYRYLRHWATSVPSAKLNIFKACAVKIHPLTKRNQIDMNFNCYNLSF